MKLIIGLGNPGPRYANTRHNVGFRVLDILMERGGNKIVSRYNSLIMETTFHDTPIVLAKPLTYMNNSGRAVAALVNQLEIPLTELCVVYDDIHLDIGVIRMRRKGSDGGHNGMKSIIGSLHTTAFPRLRIGIGFLSWRSSVLAQSERASETSHSTKDVAERLANDKNGEAKSVVVPNNVSERLANDKNGAQVDYVLSEFTDAEKPEIEASIQRATEAIETFVSDGILTTMNRFNGR